MTQNGFSRQSHWQRLRWQVFWGLVAAIAPMLVRPLIVGNLVPEGGIAAAVNAFWGALVAVLLGIYLIRNVGRYPGVEKASAIIPGFSISFGLLIVALLMLRLDYSRWALAGSYVSAIIIFYVGHTRVFGRRKLKIAVLPVGDDVAEVTGIAGIDWVLLKDVSAPMDDVNAIAVDLRKDLPDEWDKRVADLALSDMPVYHTKHLVESLTGRVQLEHLSETSYGTLSPPETYMAVKHLLDRLTAIAVLVVLAPLFLFVAVIIRLDSPGPAIFRQTRIGFRGRPFTVYKFRTMRLRVEGSAAPRDEAITRQNDSRITRVGQFLRRSRIDELPQVLNIVLGQMSWIGPRPEAVVLSEWYESEIPFYRYRHIVRPGITGWAQVMQGHVAEIGEVRSKLFYDFYYIKNFSLWIDSLIIFRTLSIMFTGYGAK
jgi:lipopolysaccharide/colanic/teichoic acid biosynthesis glycosyltransferase